MCRGSHQADGVHSRAGFLEDSTIVTIELDRGGSAFSNEGEAARIFMLTNLIWHGGPDENGPKLGMSIDKIM
jgi:hypothetical protein